MPGMNDCGCSHRSGTCASSDSRGATTTSPSRYSCWNLMSLAAPGPGPGASGSKAGCTDQAAVAAAFRVEELGAVGHGVAGGRVEANADVRLDEARRRRSRRRSLAAAAAAPRAAPATGSAPAASALACRLLAGGLFHCRAAALCAAALAVPPRASRRPGPSHTGLRESLESCGYPSFPLLRLQFGQRAVDDGGSLAIESGAHTRQRVAHNACVGRGPAYRTLRDRRVIAKPLRKQAADCRRLRRAGHVRPDSPADRRTARGIPGTGVSRRPGRAP